MTETVGTAGVPPGASGEHAMSPGFRAGPAGLALAGRAAPQPFRNRPLGYLLWGLFLVWVVAAAVAAAIVMVGVEDVPKNAVAARFLIFLLLLPAFPLYYFARKMTARSAIDRLERDGRSPVLYLREFRADSDAVVRRWFASAAAFSTLGRNADASAEDELVRVLQRIGPVVAIGRPGEAMATLGAARVYVADEDWQKVVAEVAAQASLTVIRLGETRGLRWEVEHAVRNLPPERILFYVPKSAEKTSPCYEAFRSLADTVLPRALPPLSGAPRFIRFDRSWRAWFMGEDAALLFDARPPVFLIDAQEGGGRGEAADAKALAVVFSGIGPVVALVPPGAAPPKKCAAWIAADDEAILELLDDETWRSAPVVLTARAGPRFGALLRRLSATVDPRRLVLHVPKGRQRAAIREELARNLPGAMPALKARFVIFDRFWRPQWLERRRWPPDLRPALLRQKPATAGRIGAPSLQPFFDRYASVAPGRKTAAWVWVVCAGFGALALLGLVYGRDGQSTAIARLEDAYRIERNWLGLVWGLPARQVAVHFPQVEPGARSPVGSQRRIAPTGRAVSLGGVVLPMNLVFQRERLVGALLVDRLPSGSVAAGRIRSQFESIGEALRGLYGPPTAGGDVLQWDIPPVAILLSHQREEGDGGHTALSLYIVNREIEAGVAAR